MIRWSDIYERQEHYRDIARVMDEDRFARQVSSGRALHLGPRLSSWLGQRLVAWGTDLQGRYSADLSPSR